MFRTPRIFVEGGIYHVFNRLASGETVFVDPETAMDFIVQVPGETKLTK